MILIAVASVYFGSFQYTANRQRWSYSITLQREAPRGLPPTTVPATNVRITLTPEAAAGGRVVRASLSGSNDIPDALLELEEKGPVAFEKGWCFACTSDSNLVLDSLKPPVATLSERLSSQIISVGHVVLSLQVLSRKSTQDVPSAIVTKGIISRGDKREQLYFTAILRESRFVSLTIMQGANDQDISSIVSIVPDENAVFAPLPLLFLSCYVSEMVGGQGHGVCSP